MELIDKAAIVAEIEKKIKEYSQYQKIYPDFEHYEIIIDILEELRDECLNTLETKEVDLEKAIDKWICDDAITHDDCSITDVISTAKHFYELGLKAKEGK